MATPAPNQTPPRISMFLMAFGEIKGDLHLTNIHYNGHPGWPCQISIQYSGRMAHIESVQDWGTVWRRVEALYERSQLTDASLMYMPEQLSMISSHLSHADAKTLELAIKNLWEHIDYNRSYADPGLFDAAGPSEVAKRTVQEFSSRMHWVTSCNQKQETHRASLESNGFEMINSLSRSHLLPPPSPLPSIYWEYDSTEIYGMRGRLNNPHVVPNDGQYGPYQYNTPYFGTTPLLDAKESDYPAIIDPDFTAMKAARWSMFISWEYMKANSLQRPEQTTSPEYFGPLKAFDQRWQYRRRNPESVPKSPDVEPLDLVGEKDASPLSSILEQDEGSFAWILQEEARLLQEEEAASRPSKTWRLPPTPESTPKSPDVESLDFVAEEEASPPILIPKGYEGSFAWLLMDSVDPEVGAEHLQELFGGRDGGITVEMLKCAMVKGGLPVLGAHDLDY